ncbi:MAG: hypothetical protein U9Q90_09770 [Campylobacterota bacterium]|nr:hypothetical protein [Campylobacterota bacterium]
MNRRNFMAATALFGPIALAAEVTKSVESKEGETIMADWLFVQNSKSITYADGKLTLKGVNPVTVMFTDRPVRAAEHMKTEQFIPFWSEGKESFLKDPPNAALSFLDHEKMEDVVVTLHDPVLKGENLTYRVDIIDGDLPASAEHASLFIDVVGMPLTPVSAGGVRRRTRRRVYRR